MTRPVPKNYGEYLALDQVLTAQHPRSVASASRIAGVPSQGPAHDEMMFIIVHQAYELWFKSILWELDSVLAMFRERFVDERAVGVAVQRLQRIVEIEKLLIDQVRILETMSPLDFLDFRGALGGYSGFQSFQFRLIEVKLGLRRSDRLLYSDKQYEHDLSPADRKTLEDAENAPSLFLELDEWLARTPFLTSSNFDFLDAYRSAAWKMLAEERAGIARAKGISDEERERRMRRVQDTEDNFRSVLEKERHEQLMQSGDRRFSYRATLAALLINLYRDQPILHLPYQLLSLVADIDEHLSLWRYRHTVMVLRMIGRKVGTGGSPGFDYLRATVDRHRVFGDLFNLATLLIPRSDLPPLPAETERAMAFQFTVRNESAAQRA